MIEVDVFIAVFVGIILVVLGSFVGIALTCIMTMAGRNNTAKEFAIYVLEKLENEIEKEQENIGERSTDFYVGKSNGYKDVFEKVEKYIAELKGEYKDEM